MMAQDGREVCQATPAPENQSWASTASRSHGKWHSRTGWPIILGCWLVLLAVVLDVGVEGDWLNVRGCGVVERLFVEQCR